MLIMSMEWLHLTIVRYLLVFGELSCNKWEHLRLKNVADEAQWLNDKSSPI